MYGLKHEDMDPAQSLFSHLELLSNNSMKPSHLSKGYYEGYLSPCDRAVGVRLV